MKRGDIFQDEIFDWHMFVTKVTRCTIHYVDTWDHRDVWDYKSTITESCTTYTTIFRD